MYRASDEREHADWLKHLEAAADRLNLGTGARSRARDVFLLTVEEADGSKQTTLATSLYVGALVAGEEQSQQTVADAVGVSRLSIQQRWKDQLRAAGLEPPDW